MAGPDEVEASGGSGTTAQEDLSEALDQDKLPGDFPPDRPMGSLDYGVTPQEERIDEPLAERVRRERPDFDELAEGGFVGEEGRVGRLVAPDEGVHDDVEAAAVADEIDEIAAHDLPVGDVGTGDTTTYDVATELTQDLSAEEAAMHVREVP